LLPDRVVGAISVYAYGKDVFDEHAAEFGELFAKPAAVAVHNAQIRADALALTVQSQTALSTAGQPTVRWHTRRRMGHAAK
jgi:hypothetical protein